MTNPTSERLGRNRGNYTERAHKKLVQKMCERLREETGFKGDLARSVEELSDERS